MMVMYTVELKTFSNNKLKFYNLVFVYSLLIILHQFVDMTGLYAVQLVYLAHFKVKIARFEQQR